MFEGLSKNRMKVLKNCIEGYSVCSFGEDAVFRRQNFFAWYRSSGHYVNRNRFCQQFNRIYVSFITYLTGVWQILMFL